MPGKKQQKPQEQEAQMGLNETATTSQSQGTAPAYAPVPQSPPPPPSFFEGPMLPGSPYLAPVPPYPYLYPPPPGSPSYHQGALSVLEPVKHIDLCKEGGLVIALDENRSRLFNVMYGPYVHHTSASAHTNGSTTTVSNVNHNNFKLNILDLVGNIIVHADFPGDGGTVPIFIGDRVAASASVPALHESGWGKGLVNHTSVSSSTPGSPNYFGFRSGELRGPINVVRKVPRIGHPPRPAPKQNSFTFPSPITPAPVIIVGTLEIDTADKPNGFSINFTDPSLDVEAKVLILAVARHVKTVLQREGQDACEGCCCTIL